MKLNKKDLVKQRVANLSGRGRQKRGGLVLLKLKTSNLGLSDVMFLPTCRFFNRLWPTVWKVCWRIVYPDEIFFGK